MSVARNLVLILVLAVVLSGCTKTKDPSAGGSPIQAQSDKTVVAQPGWQAGYSWAWDVRSESYEKGVLDGETIDDESALDYTLVMEVLGTDFDMRGRPVYLTATEEQQDGPREMDPFMSLPMAVYQDDLSSYNVQEILFDCAGPLACVEHLNSVDTSLPETAPIRFPLAKGAAWQQPFLFDDDGKLDALVVGKENIYVDGANLETMHITITGGLNQVIPDGGKLRKVTATLVNEVYYSAERQQVVMSDLTVEGTVKSTTVGDGGEEVLEIYLHEDRMMVSTNLKASTNLDARGVWNWFHMEDRIFRDIFIQLSGAFGTGKGNTDVGFEGLLTNVPDQELSWRVVDRAGTEYGSGAGTKGEVTLPYGGMYYVIIDAAYEGEILFTKYRAFYLDLKDSLDVNCDAVVLNPGGTSGSGSCPAAKFPVNAGASRLELTGRVVGTAGATAGGSLEVRDASGAVATTETGNPASPKIEEGLGVGEWAMEYTPAGGAQLEAEYDWVISYRHDGWDPTA